MKFFNQHRNLIVKVALSVGLISLLDWDWSHFKSFVTGAVIFWSFEQELD